MVQRPLEMAGMPPWHDDAGDGWDATVTVTTWSCTRSERSLPDWALPQRPYACGVSDTASQRPKGLLVGTAGSPRTTCPSWSGFIGPSLPESAGNLIITLIADPDTCPDLSDLRDALEEEVRALTAMTQH